MKKIIFILLIFSGGFSIKAQSIAREWNELLLESIRNDLARPTVHARNLYHISAAMYDAWAVYHNSANPYFLNQTRDGYTFSVVSSSSFVYSQNNIEASISYAAYRLLNHRFSSTNNYTYLKGLYDNLFALHGYDLNFTSTDISLGDARALGNLIASEIIAYGLLDGSNEQNGYENQYYFAINPALIFDSTGNPNINNLNRWQPLSFDVFIDQSGNPFPLDVPDFLSPEWGNVYSFAMEDSLSQTFSRYGEEYKVFYDPGAPPYIDDPMIDSNYRWNFAMVSTWSSHLDPADPTLWDISPASIGGLDSVYTDTKLFYDYLNGGDPSGGHAVNPISGMPYATQMVPRADYARVLAEFWADGPDSETPPGHWFDILNYVSDHPQLVKKLKGLGDTLSDLEWDVKAYFTLGGAMHDAAVAAWSVKGWYDYIRPVSAIRAMAENGQSSDVSLPNYNALGLPLIAGYIELIDANDPLVGSNSEYLNDIKIKAWKGPSYINDPTTDVAGVDWILAKDFMPYQRPTFVTPPFAGYVSGHSTFSRAAAEVLTLFTGDAFFPGGMGEFFAQKDSFLVFEKGPSVDVTLQWATYRDASDQCSLSRIWGGIHPPVDDLPGRKMGEKIGISAFEYASEYFLLDNDNDGYTADVDCNDNNPAIHPGASELCDGIDNNCSGAIDEGLQVNRYYLDNDGDGYGNVQVFIDTCLAFSPFPNYIMASGDCNDNNAAIHPGASELCDGIDNNCSGAIDEGLQVNRYYLDNDSDGYGNTQQFIDTCLMNSPFSNYITVSGDCNDNNAAIHPGATELCDGVDNNCSGVVDEGLPTNRYYFDNDGDGFGDSAVFIETCMSSAFGFVLDSTDCNDANPMIHPAAFELCDGLDNDCNGFIDDGLSIYRYYKDADGDTYGDKNMYIDTCESGLNLFSYVEDSTDCNDANPIIFPGSTNQIAGIDYNCSGFILGDDLIAKGISIYPNPISNHLFIHVNDIQDPLKVHIKDIIGNTMILQILKHTLNEINMEHLPAGYYHLTVSNSDNHMFFQKSVIKK